MSSKKQFEGSTLAEIYFGVTDWPHEVNNLAIFVNTLNISLKLF